MNRANWVPLNTDNWLIFSLFDDSGLPYTSGVNADFTIDLLRDGVNVPVHGLEVHHIGSGRYHITNSGSAAVPYRSTSEEQIYIRAWHSVYGGYNLAWFWAKDFETEVDVSSLESDVSMLKALILGLY